MAAQKVYASIPENLYERIDAEAVKRGRPLSAIIAERLEKSYAMEAVTRAEFLKFADFTIAAFTEVVSLQMKLLPEAEKELPDKIISRILAQCKK